MPTTAPPMAARVVAVLAVAAAALSQIAYDRGTFDSLQLPKALVLWVAAALVLLFLVFHALRERRLPTLPRMDAVALAAVPLALVVSLVATDDVMASLVGSNRRHGGVLTYLAVATLAAGIVAAAPRVPWLARNLLLALLAGAAISTLVALLQWIGLDPLSLSGGEPVGLAGNTNYAAAVAACLAGGCLVVLTAPERPPWHLGLALTGMALAGTVAIASQTLQGPALLLVAPVVPVVALLRRRSGAMAARGIQALAALAVVGLVVVGAGVYGAGPAGRLAEEMNVQERHDFWRAAVNMVADSPVVGQGADRYLAREREFRVPRQAIASGASETRELRLAGDPHNVPLAMAANGGILALLAHLAMVVIVGRRLWRGLRSMTGERALLLAGAGAAWFTYQVQSLVSIDVPPLVAIHWFAAAAILALTRSDPAMADGAPGAGAAKKASGRDRAAARKREAAAFGVLAPTGARLGFAVVAVPLALLLLRGTWVERTSQHSVQFARFLMGAERYEQAADHYGDAADRAPWRSDYRIFEADALLREGRETAAERRLIALLERDPTEVWALQYLIDITIDMRQYGEAAEWARQMTDIDANYAHGWIQRSRVALVARDVEAAEEFARTAIALGEGELEGKYSWIQLGIVLEQGGDRDGAAEAYRRALELDGELEEALAGLERVT